MEADDELSKDAWKDWKAEKQKKASKEKGKEKERNKVKEKKAGIFTKMRRVQLISGKIADRIEPIRAYASFPYYYYYYYSHFIVIIKVLFIYCPPTAQPC